MALGIIFLVCLFGLLRLVLVLGFLIKSLLGLSLARLLLLVSLLVFLITRGAKALGIPVADADEVGEKSNDNDGPGELSEQVVPLLILDVALLGGAPAVVDCVALVDPHEVDDGPASLKGGRHDDHDAGAGKAASVGDVVLAEPNDEEGGSHLLTLACFYFHLLDKRLHLNYL